MATPAAFIFVTRSQHTPTYNNVNSIGQLYEESGRTYIKLIDDSSPFIVADTLAEIRGKLESLGVLIA